MNAMDSKRMGRTTRLPIALGTLGLTILAAASAAQAAQADSGNPAQAPCGPRHQRMAEEGRYGMMAGLPPPASLTPDEQKRWREIGDKHRDEAKSLMKRMRDTRTAVMQAPAEDPALAQLAQAHGQALADLMVLGKRVQAEREQVFGERAKRPAHRPRGPA